MHKLRILLLNILILNALWNFSNGYHNSYILVTNACYNSYSCTLKNITAKYLWITFFDNFFFEQIPFVIGDINHDKKPEIIVLTTKFANNDHYVFFSVLDSKNGDILQNISLFVENKPQSFTASDLNNDGYVDFIIQTLNCVYAINGKNFSVDFVINIPRIISDGCVNTEHFITYDLNGDGFRDLIFTVNYYRYNIVDILIYSGKNGEKVSEILINNTQIYNVFVYVSKFVQEIITFDINGILRIFDINGNLILIKKFSELKWPHVSPLLDLNSDGTPDVICVSKEKCIAIDLFTGNILWETTVPYSSRAEFTYFPSAIGDINSDGILDIILLEKRNLCIISSNGRLLYYSELPYDCDSLGASIGDGDGDDQNELFLTLSYGGLFLFDWNKKEKGITFAGIGLYITYTPPLIADIDNDSKIETIICDWSENALIVVDLPKAGWRTDFSNPFIDSMKSRNYIKIDPDLDCLSNYSEKFTKTDPNDSDTDDDGTIDGWEVSWGFDPLRNDSYLDPDEDGLTNLQEFIYTTNPLYWDSDGDGFSDGEEIRWGCDPLNPNDNPRSRLIQISVIVIIILSTIILVTTYHYKRHPKKTLTYTKLLLFLDFYNFWYNKQNSKIYLINKS